VQITEATEDADNSTLQEQQSSEEETVQQLPATRFQIRPEHFARAIDEQRERYALQEEVEEAITRKEEGRQRLLEMATNYNPDRERRGFFSWLKRLLGLTS
jgi:transitional endoplasmic reticulum ATPase